MRSWGMRVTITGALLASLVMAGVTGLARAAHAYVGAAKAAPAHCGTQSESDPGFLVAFPEAKKLDPGFLLPLPDSDRIDPGFRLPSPCPALPSSPRRRISAPSSLRETHRAPSGPAKGWVCTATHAASTRTARSSRRPCLVIPPVRRVGPEADPRAPSPA